MKKTKRKVNRKVKPAVRGPQLGLKLGKAKGEPPRTARVRYVEPPTKREGNPFFALRVPRDLLKAFLAYARKTESAPNDLVRSFMARSTGLAIPETCDVEG